MAHRIRETRVIPRRWDELVRTLEERGAASAPTLAKEVLTGISLGTQEMLSRYPSYRVTRDVTVSPDPHGSRVTYSAEVTALTPLGSVLATRERWRAHLFIKSCRGVPAREASLPELRDPPWRRFPGDWRNDPHNPIRFWILHAHTDETERNP